MSQSTFLSAAEIADMTDIKTGRNGKTREQLQCEHLRNIGVPFFPSAHGAPKVARAYIEGRRMEDQPEPRWKPAALRTGT